MVIEQHRFDHLTHAKLRGLHLLTLIGFEPMHFLVKFMTGNTTCLEVGAGTGNTAIMLRSLKKRPRFLVGLEIFPHYASHLQRQQLYDSVVIGDARYLPFKEGSFKTAIAFDLLEHLSKSEGRQLIERLRLVASSALFIMTPNGFVHQNPFDENPFQEHHSGWTTKDLKRMGFEVIGVRGLKCFWNMFSNRPIPFRFLTYFLGGFSQPLARRFPEKAFQLLAVRQTHGQKTLGGFDVIQKDQSSNDPRLRTRSLVEGIQ